MMTLTSLTALNSRDDRVDITLVVLMCSFNRRAKTLNALRSFSEQSVSANVLASVVLFDDGSDDGTADAVSAAFPEVEILHGDGSAYWSRGMAQAQEFALDAAQPDHFCWLNDDVTLTHDALDVLLMTARSCHDRVVVVGPLTDGRTSDVTYSGYVRTGSRPTQLQHIAPDGRPRPVDTFNGNVVLVPRAVYERVGSIDPRYEHSYGDTDYGYRVARAGLGSVLAPRVVGSCPRNSLTGTWRDPRLGVRIRLALLVSRKGIPPRSYVYFQRRHGDRRWAANVLGTYLQALRTISRSRNTTSVDEAGVAGVTLANVRARASHGQDS